VRGLRTLSLVGIGAAALAVASYALGAGGGRLYRNEAMRIKAFIVPASWEQSPQPGYPHLLVSYAHEQGALITLTAEKSPRATSADELAEKTRPLLERQGFRDLKTTPGELGTRVDGNLPSKSQVLRQVYIYSGGVAYVVTLVAPSARAAPLTRDFEEALRTLVLMPPEAAMPDGGARDAS
jgi:hypothetical protein